MNEEDYSILQRQWIRIPKVFFLQTDLKSVCRNVLFHLVVKIHVECLLRAKVEEFGEAHLFPFCQWVRCENLYHSHICPLNMKLPPAASSLIWLQRETASLVLSKGNKICRSTPLKTNLLSSSVYINQNRSFLFYGHAGPCVSVVAWQWQITSCKMDNCYFTHWYLFKLNKRNKGLLSFKVASRQISIKWQKEEGRFPFNPVFVPTLS